MTKRQQAPGELEHVRAFVNTLEFDQHVERLERAVDLTAWLVRRDLARPGLRASRTDLDHATRLREALRAILLAHNDTEPAAPGPYGVLDDAARRARLRLRFGDDDTSVLEAQAPGVHGALGRLLIIVHGAIAQGTWKRLKACREHTCEWAFYDHTKNRSGTWCAMEVCGNRAKARSYRERRAVVG